MDTGAIKNYLVKLHEHLVACFTEVDGARFRQDEWRRTDGGGGLSCVLEEGNVFERAGVNFAHVSGPGLPSSASAARPELSGRSFEAMGVSVVMHPRNPYVPTVHFNARFICARPSNNAAGSSALPSQGAAEPATKPAGTGKRGASGESNARAGAQSKPVWWFGGGMDLTPYYGFEEDAVHFHKTCREALAPFGKGYYLRFKKWCDEYFYLKHRSEPRGIGGIFFDDFNEPGLEHSFEMLKRVGDYFLPAYLPIVERRRHLAYGERERDFQAYRRGRYVEFNLVYDRGTLFGLQSGGRAESILMSLPPTVKWRYDWKPEAGSPEAKLFSDFLIARDWV